MTDAVSCRCSFCDKSRDEVRKLVERPAASICDECLNLCQDILEELRSRLTQEDEEQELRDDEPRPTCSFCGTSFDSAYYVIAGPRGYVCGDCVARFSN